jgi:hypothetical protein
VLYGTLNVLVSVMSGTKSFIITTVPLHRNVKESKLLSLDTFDSDNFPFK